MERIRKDELLNYDGSEGKKAYVAFEGKIYDVTQSKLWKSGRHLKTHQAGRDLTMGMKAAPHGVTVLERFEQVAELEQEKKVKPTVSAIKTPPEFLSPVLNRHPHPISVHFPIALCTTAAFFSILGLLIKNDTLQKTALYNMIIAALSAPASIATGFLSWYYNYSGIWTHIYRMKTLLSVVLVLLFISALVIHFGFLTGADCGALWHWVYTCIVIAMAPTVIGLGYYGGKITFPS
ncbi:MAG TPA: DUF2231 domain-containing protein [archaeon]|nr:DUF2231 domain-containing protein [archaeon]